MGLLAFLKAQATGGLLSQVLSRVAFGIPVILIIIVVTFVLTRMAPGDPATLLAGDAPTPEFLAAIRKEYGLDEPLLQQLLTYLLRAIQFDFGTSIYYQRPVMGIIMERFPATLLLTGSATLLAAALGILFGVWSARNRGSGLDTAISAASLVGYSIPAFWLGQLLILVFAVHLNVLPAGGMSSPRENYAGFAYMLDVARHMILPTITLATFELALITRFTRTAMIEALGKEYVLVARAKGARMGYVVWAHAFPNAVVTTVTIIGLEFGVLLAGAVLTETIYGWPGLGRLFFDAIFRRDFPLLSGCFIFASVCVVAVNLLTDIICSALDPRIRR
ncbi:MAG: ABC transporter permease [Xanthobacteraceae bacterium]|nr:ABC transporter permease [Xanthobacteraceae bacterium]